MSAPAGIWQRAAGFLIRRYGSKKGAAATLQQDYGMAESVAYRLLRGEAKTIDWLEELLAREGVPLLEALFPELLAERDAAAERLRLTLESRVDHHTAAGNSDEALCLTRLMLRPDLDDIVRRTEGGWVRRAGRAVANL
ncbi:hypothetical protein ABNQ39_00470, partial (plasmid) [Azospirillum sp. A26]|uniref:hypothetical protein n=1 Tax=Azospirillum sp. A26 TaxID=3160607 RepID=UPI00366A8CF2